MINKYNSEFPEETNDQFNLKSSDYYGSTNRELQDEVMNMINGAKESLTIVQPYYYPIKKIEKALEDALERGVKIELITSAKRDQPCYKALSNVLMTKKLMAKGLEVYEVHNKLLHMKLYI